MSDHSEGAEEIDEDLDEDLDEESDLLVDQLIRSLELRGAHFEEFTVEFAENNRKIAMLCVDASMFKKAITYCITALQSYTNLKTPLNPSIDMDMAITIRLLAVIYLGAGKPTKARKMNDICEGLLKKYEWIGYYWSCVEIAEVKILVSNRTYEKAIARLDDLIPKMERSGRFLAYMEKALIFLEKQDYASVQVCLKMGLDIIQYLESKTSTSVKDLYQRMTDVYIHFEDLNIVGVDTFKFIQKMMKFVDENRHGRDLGWKILVLVGKYKLKIGKEIEAIRDFLCAEDWLKNYLTRHIELGKIYELLGEAFSKRGDHHMAVHMLRLAKENFDDFLVEEDPKLIEISEKLRSEYHAAER
ncbi:hypothetical protein BVC80_9099g201 [Macleaya cordata]|uniref:Tetratricopeptide-like helical domain n=1 Tax=Macleaya cordata TaxID=56857 RepID=A0A200PW40_MACCD|nr:hypothetical protein BVC80_9099g201 [Macleaya cordata]